MFVDPPPFDESSFLFRVLNKDKQVILNHVEMFYTMHKSAQ